MMSSNTMSLIEPQHALNKRKIDALETEMRIKNCKIFKITTDYRFAMVYLNDGKPWWRKKRVRLFVGPNQFVIYDAPDGTTIDLSKLWIKFEGSEELFPLHHHCEFM